MENADETAEHRERTGVEVDNITQAWMILIALFPKSTVVASGSS